MIRVTSYILFYIGLILRCIHVDENRDTFTAARIVLAYDLELWFLRSFTFLGIAQKMGPKLVMIRKMVKRFFFKFLSYFFLFELFKKKRLLIYFSLPTLF